MIVFILFRYLWIIVYYIVYSNFMESFFTVYLYFRYTQIVFLRKSACDGGKKNQ